MGTTMIWVWLAVIVFTLIYEFNTVMLTSVWFTAGALVALILSFFPPIPWWVQTIVFVIVSFVLLLSVRKIALKYFIKNQNENLSNLDRYVNNIYRISKIDEETKKYYIKINDVDWLVIDDENDYELNEKIRLVEFRNNQVKIEKIKKQEEEK